MRCILVLERGSLNLGFCRIIGSREREPKFRVL